MKDQIVVKTIPLPIASGPEDISSTLTHQEILDQEARVQAHMARVHPKIDAIRKEEASVRKKSGSSIERSRINSRRAKQKRVAKKKAEAIAAKKKELKQHRP